LYWDVKVTPEDEDEMIRKIAEKVHNSGLDVAAILLIESVKPLAYLGTQMGRFFVSPFLPVFGEDIGISGEKLFQTFEKRENVEKLIRAVEKLNQEEKEKKKAEKAKRIEAKGAEAGVEVASKKTGWRRFLPFLNS
jgi:hypothetical protein